MVAGGYLDRCFISCGRCNETPGLRLNLGCGKPPTANNDPMRAGTRLLGDGRAVSPAEAVALGLPAFTMGVGEIRADWPWCPRWWDAFSDETIDGQPTADVFSEAFWYIDKGSASAVYPGEFTPAMVDGIRLHRALRSEHERLQHEAEIKRIKGLNSGTG